jgi:hypothetical protein
VSKNRIFTHLFWLGFAPLTLLILIFVAGTWKTFNHPEFPITKTRKETKKEISKEKILVVHDTIFVKDECRRKHIENTRIRKDSSSADSFQAVNNF